MDLIYEYSRGVPRLIHLACERALLTGYAEGIKPVDGRLMQQVVAELLPYHAGFKPEPTTAPVALESPERLDSADLPLDQEIRLRETKRRKG